MTGERPCILRHGGVTLEQLEAVVGTVDVHRPDSEAETSPDARTQKPQTAAIAPGMLSQHYSPTTPLALFGDSDSESLVGRRVGLLLFTQPKDRANTYDSFTIVEALTEDGDLRTAAASFFAALRRLDAQGLDLILAERFPNEGLGRALNDRLLRACHQ
jgi:L-threonylcarbamoyladenylate synthase